MSKPPTYKTQKYPRYKDLSSARWLILLAVIFLAGFLLYKVAFPSEPRESVRSDAGAVLNANGQAQDRR